MFAPNAQKARNLLNMSNIPYKIVEQPFVQPRPIMTNLGITYRRVPVNSIGKDFYVDNRTFMQAVQDIFPNNRLPATIHDHAYEAFGYRNFFIILICLPVEFLTEDLIKERADLFKEFGNPEYKELRPSAMAQMRQFFDIIEHDFLRDATDDKPWIAGASSCGLADIHASWIPKFTLETLQYDKNEPCLSKEHYPKTYRWLAGIKSHSPETEPEKLNAEAASKNVLEQPYYAKEIGIDSTDPTGLQAGDMVALQTTDDVAPENAKQKGKLVGLSPREIVIELENGIRIHSPRIGYAIRKV